MQYREEKTVDPPNQGTSVENLEASVIEGTCNEVQSQKPSYYLSISDGIPVGALVPVKVKNKIWANDYVDLRSLLPKHEQDPFTLTVKSVSINVQHNAKAKTPLSVHQWTDAFLIFTCIYLEKFLLEALYLLKYLSFVREMRKLHGESAWRNYDESFRHLKENSNLPWQKPVEELRIKAIAANSLASKTTFQPFRGKQANRSFVKFCFAFNQGEKCKQFPCHFTNLCRSCRGNHPRIRCKTDRKSDKTTRSSNPSLGRALKA